MTQRFHHAAALSLKQLSYLVAVAETLNFTKAAEQCFVTQSTLSGGVSELERLLGVRLVERDRQRVALTEVGAEVVRRAQDILSASHDLISLAQQAADPASGVLKLGVIPTIAPFLLTHILKTCRKHFPNLQVTVRENQTLVLLAEVESGDLDAAVLALPVDLGKLQSTLLFEETLCLIAPKDDPLAGQTGQKLADLDASNRLVLLEKGHCLREHSLLACGTQPDKSGEGGSVEATNLSTMVQLVDSGIGCALVPDMAVKAGILNGAEVVQVALADPLPTRTIALVTRASHPKLEFLEGELAQALAHCQKK
ncbi:MAG TPA: hydrogen peroxide-inducible genes activator [Limnobacter sp.]|nr:hydrogen peroxide-inducible genes activator [Limnobacter sp.]